MIHNLHHQRRALERAAREIMRTACGQRVGLVTRAKAHSADLHASHRPLSRCPQSWPSSQVRQQSFFLVLFSDGRSGLQFTVRSGFSNRMECWIWHRAWRHESTFSGRKKENRSWEQSYERWVVSGSPESAWCVTASRSQAGREVSRGPSPTSGSHGCLSTAAAGGF